MESSLCGIFLLSKAQGHRRKTPRFKQEILFQLQAITTPHSLHCADLSAEHCRRSRKRLFSQPRHNKFKLMTHLNCGSDQIRLLLFCERSARHPSSAAIGKRLNSAGGKRRHLLQKLGDVLAAALGPGPRVGVIVEGGSHDVVLVLHACLPAFWVVIVRHVEPGTGREKGTHTQGDYRAA